jgi:hypothetical protein
MKFTGGNMFFEMNEILVFCLLIAFSWLAIEIGYRLGLARRASSDDIERSHIGSLQGALLGLLALLLGFSFAMSVARFDARRALVLKEANAIGTAYLRTSFLPEEQGREARKLLRTYVDSRLGYVNAKTNDELLTRAFATAASLQAQLWTIATNATTQDPRSVPAGLFAASLNDVIDVSEERVTAFYSNVPEPILGLLVVVSCGAMGFVGYGCGLAGRRRLTSTIVFSLLSVLVLLIVLDVDRPREGLIQVSQGSMLRLQESIRGDGP